MSDDNRWIQIQLLRRKLVDNLSINVPRIVVLLYIYILLYTYCIFYKKPKDNCKSKTIIIIIVYIVYLKNTMAMYTIYIKGLVY